MSSGETNSEMVWQSVAVVWRNKKLWLLHVLSNLALLGGIYAWLWIPERSVWQLIGGGVLAILLVVLLVWLHAGTMYHYQRSSMVEPFGAWASYRAVLPRLPALLLGAGIAAAALVGGWWLESQVPAAADWLASALTLSRQKPFSPESAGAILAPLAWLVRWYALPLLLLPSAVCLAANGFRGFGFASIRAAVGSLTRLWYWACGLVLVGLGIYLPSVLAAIKPPLDSSLWLQATSMVVRLGVAYLLFVTSWLLLVSLVGTLQGAARSRL